MISLSCACPRIMKVKTCNNQFVAMLREDWRFLSSGLWAPYFWICPYVYAETCPIQSQGLEQNFISHFPVFEWNHLAAHLRSAYVGSGGNSRSNTVHYPISHANSDAFSASTQIISPHLCSLFQRYLLKSSISPHRVSTRCTLLGADPSRGFEAQGGVAA